MLKKLAVGLVMISCLNNVFAIDKDQASVINLKNNDTVHLSLSTHNPNRLFVDQDKITQAACQQGYCIVNYDQSGSIYLSLGYPARLSSQGFSIFIETENNKHFTIIGEPDNLITGKTVEFKVTGSSKKAREFEKKTPYQELLIKIIRSMMTYQSGDDLDYGLSVQSIQSNDEVPPNDEGILIIPTKVFFSDQFKGEVYLVKNLTDKTISLTTKSFYQENMVAGALSDFVLKPKTSTYFYGVFEQGEDHA
ncbi:type-F conjugative transfer system secretin TraK [Thiotrichales bacterium 19S11-10]|nr:type-F conjugative transfer system secretin TraK [Thiotrichales bacterium 19S11-10]